MIQATPLHDVNVQLTAKENLFQVQKLFNAWDPKDEEVFDKLMDIVDILEDRVDECCIEEDHEF